MINFEKQTLFWAGPINRKKKEKKKKTFRYLYVVSYVICFIYIIKKKERDQGRTFLQ